MKGFYYYSYTGLCSLEFESLQALKTWGDLAEKFRQDRKAAAEEAAAADKLRGESLLGWLANGCQPYSERVN